MIWWPSWTFCLGNACLPGLPWEVRKDTPALASDNISSLRLKMWVTEGHPSFRRDDSP
jgi:hypothetical protein